MEHKSSFDKSYGSKDEHEAKLYKVKMQCNGCGFITSTEKCKCGQGTMHRYRKPF